MHAVEHMNPEGFIQIYAHGEPGSFHLTIHDVMDSQERWHIHYDVKVEIIFDTLPGQRLLSLISLVVVWYFSYLYY